MALRVGTRLRSRLSILQAFLQPQEETACEAVFSNGPAPMVAFTPPASRARPTSAPATRSTGWCARWEQVTGLGLAASIFVIPLLLGGARPAGHIALLILSFATGAAWLLSRAGAESPEWKWLGVEMLVLAAAALVAIQLVPLPDEWLEAISPRLVEVLPLWSGEGNESGLGRWHTISVAPAETLNCLVTYAAYTVLFLVAAQRLSSTGDAQRIMRWIAAAVVGQAVFGLLQFFLSNGKFFWFYLHPYVSTADEVHGSFINRNHTAHFLALGMGPLLMLALGEPATRAGRNGFSSSSTSLAALARPAAWAGVGCVVLASALTMSRGGLLALGAAAVVFMVASRQTRRRQTAVLPVAGVIALGVGAAMFVPGAERVEHRLATVASLDVDQVDQGLARRRIWETVASAIPDFPVLGAGLGTMRPVYPMYFDERDERLEYTTADNGYLELALEAGLPGLILVVAALALLVSRCLSGTSFARTPEQAACLAAALAGVAASAVHALVESNWFIPGCMMLLIPLAASGIALSAGAGRDGAARPIRVPRPVWGAAAVCLAASLYLAVPIKQARLQDAAAWKLLDPLTTDTRASASASLDPGEWRQQLDGVSELSSCNPQTHLALAGQYLQLFEELQRSSANPMTLTEIRETVTAAEFESSDEINEWLQRAFAGNAECLHLAQRHAARCVELCPLEGRAYTFLAELCFINGQDAEFRERLIRQSGLVRPYDGQVLFATGQFEFQRGDMESALRHWRSAYHRSRIWEAAVTNSLIHIMPVESFLSEFQPDWMALRHLRHRLKDSGHPEYRLVVRRLAEATVERAETVEPDEAAELLVEAYQEYVELDEPDAALQCVLAAVQRQPASYDAHLRAGQCLHTQQRYSDAVRELRWCLRRRPNDQLTSELLRTAIESESLEAPSLFASRASTHDVEASAGTGDEISTAAFFEQDADGNVAGRRRERASVTRADFISPPPPKE